MSIAGVVQHVDGSTLVLLVGGRRRVLRADRCRVEIDGAGGHFADIQNGDRAEVFVEDDGETFRSIRIARKEWSWPSLPEMPLVETTAVTPDNKLLYILVCYDRPHYLSDWLRGWRQCWRENAVLYVVNTGNVEEPSLPDDSHFVTMPNDGLDIGVLRRMIERPPESYDLLMWGPDDFLMMRKDFLDFYRRPFADPRVGLVGTFWGDFQSQLFGAPGHVRSGGVCLRREVAERLVFPPEVATSQLYLKQKVCFEFEFRERNFWKQCVDMGYVAKLSDGAVPPNSPMWYSTGPERHAIMWDRDAAKHIRGPHAAVQPHIAAMMWERFNKTFS